MFLFEELAITGEQTDMVRFAIARLVAEHDRSLINAIVNVHLVRGARSELWYDRTIGKDVPELKKMCAKLSFDTMWALANRLPSCALPENALYGYARARCANYGVEIHVDIAGLPHPEATKEAHVIANDIAAHLSWSTAKK